MATRAEGEVDLADTIHLMWSGKKVDPDQPSVLGVLDVRAQASTRT